MPSRSIIRTGVGPHREPGNPSRPWRRRSISSPRERLAFSRDETSVNPSARSSITPTQSLDSIVRGRALREAGLTGGRTEVDFDAVAARFVLVFAPTHAVLARGAAHALALPIHRKGVEAEAPLPPVLPTHVLGRGPDKVDPVALPGLHKLSGAHVGGINQMRARGQPLAGERGMNGAGAPGL